MLLKKVLLTLSTGVAIVLGAIAIVIACQPSSQPPQCAQSIFLAKFAPGVFVIPPGTGSFTVPIGMFPFVTWDDPTAACADPVSATLTATLSCTDVTGAMYTVGPQTFTQTTPSVPGPQPAGGTTVGFVMPGGILPSVCTVMGGYDVGFGAGIGAGTLTGVGDLQICLVEPSPDDPSGDTPRLDLELLTPDPLPGRDGEDGVYTFHAGDQEYIYIRIDNNDLENKLEIDFESIGRQTSLFPEGFNDDATAYGAGVFRISNPDDTFPAEFFFDDSPSPFDRLPGDPGGIGEGKIETKIELEPGEVEVFGIAINSFGACADGSCNERNLCGTGLFFDENGNEVARDPACIQFNYLVDNTQAPRYPGITFGEEIKVAPNTDSQWSNLSFFDGNDLIDQTHKGNLINAILPLPAIQVTGDQIPQDPIQPQFSNQWFDQITLPQRPTSVEWDAIFFIENQQLPGTFLQTANQVTLNGVDHLNQPCNLDNILYPGVPIIQVEADVTNGCGDDTPIILREGGQIVHQGTLAQLKADPNLLIDPLTCRTITPMHDVINTTFMVADPPFIVHNFEPDDDDPLQRAIRILDQLDRELDWQVRFEALGIGGGVALVGTQGRGTSNILIDPTVLDPNNPYDEIAGFLIYENNQAVNSPLAVPVLTRRLPPPPMLLPIDFEFDAPPLAQVGQSYDAGIFIPPLDPEPIDPYFNMEFFIGIETNDDIEIEIPDPFPFVFVPIDPDTPEPELERLRGKFGEDPINRCSEGVWKCGKIEFGDGFEFETEIFVDGFESGDISSWSTGAAADNSETRTKVTRVGVLNEDKKQPVITEEELRKAIELFNDDVVFDEKTIGLVSEHFGVNEPLPPAKGTYFFDEFESFRKSAQAPVTVDFDGCVPDPSAELYCGFVLQAGGGVNGLRIQNAPAAAIEASADSILVTNNELVDNAVGVQVSSGVGTTIQGNIFSGNGLGIDLGGDGVTDNDDGDGDTGPNNLQNYPVLSEALIGGSSTITGTFNSTPSETFTLEFFASQTGECAGENRNGEMLLGTAAVTTGSDGNVPFSVVVDSTVARKDYVTATATDAGGNTSELSACVQVVTGVATEVPEEVPATFALEQNYPNPFNPTTRIRYAVPEASPVRLEVFDVLGRLVAVLLDEMKAAGTHEVLFDARGLPSGTYLYTMTGDGFKQTKTLILMK